MKYTLVGLMLLFSLPAFGHGDAEWIEQGKYRSVGGTDPGLLCCGENDCGMVEKDAAHATAAGWEIHGEVFNFKSHLKFRVDEIVPYSETQPSPDGEFWYCMWGGTRKCFFAPPPSM